MTPLELFFDLVFVLSFTQVTATMAADPTWEGLGEGMLVLAAVWWAWAAYGWLTNAIDADENVNRLCMFAAMAAMLVVSLAIPEAFGDEGLLFGCAYFFVRAMHLILYVRNTRRAGDEDNLGAILKLAPGFLLRLGAVHRRRRSSTARRGSIIWLVAVADRLRHTAALRHRGVPPPPRSLRRAPRADRDHRARRVDRRDRRRRRVRARRRRGGRRGARDRGGGGAVVGLLRHRRARRRAAADARPGPASRRRWRATPTATCTSR